MSLTSTEQALKAQVESQFRDQGDALELEVDDDLLMAGLDSIGFVRLVEFVQDEFGIEVPAADVTVEQFGTIERVARYLEGRKGSG